MTAIERRVFELLGERKSSPEIAAELGMTPMEALPTILKVIDDYGTPNLAAARRAIDHLGTINVVRTF